MSTDLLDDYEQQLQALIEEVQEFQGANVALRDISSSLYRIGTTNDDVGRSLGQAADDLKAMLASLRDLHLDDVEARNAEHFGQHQRSLEQVAAKVQSVVQEQQRLALESLQHSMALQRQIDAVAAGLQGKIDTSITESARQTVETGAELKGLVEILTIRTTEIDSRTTGLEHRGKSGSNG